MLTNQYQKYLVFLILICSFKITNAAKITEIAGINAPDDVAFYDDNNEKHYLADFGEKTLLLTFWATWCSPCIKEMPDLDILQKDFRKLPFEVIAVSQDYQGSAVVKPYFKNNDIRYLKIYYDHRNQLFNAFSVVGLPTSLLINQDGKIVMSFVGSINWYDSEIRNIILAHIPGNHPEPKNSYKTPDLNQVVKTKTKQNTKQNTKQTEVPEKNPVSEQSIVDQENIKQQNIGDTDDQQ